MWLLDLVFENPVRYLTIVFVVVSSIVLHELGHVAAATFEGDPTPAMRGRMTWKPWVHMGWMSLVLVFVVGIGWGATPVDRRHFRHRRWGDVIVSAAGPAVHVVLAFVAAGALSLMQHAAPTAPANLAALWVVALHYNVLLLLLNLIPLPPMDGFHVLEGIFDLGEFGAWLRRIHPLPLIAVIFLINAKDSPFDAWVGMVIRGIGRLVGLSFE